MRTLYVTIVALAGLLGATAHAQLPFPFEPEPDFSQRAQCTRDYVRSIERQAEALAKLRQAGPEAVGRICSLIEMGSAWLGGELPDDVRRELRGLLGVDIDLERVRTQCRAGQDALEREIITKLAQVRSELLRCNDTI